MTLAPSKRTSNHLVVSHSLEQVVVALSQIPAPLGKSPRIPQRRRRFRPMLHRFLTTLVAAGICFCASPAVPTAPTAATDDPKLDFETGPLPDDAAFARAAATDPIRMLRLAAKRYKLTAAEGDKAVVSGYSATFLKRERIGGKLHPPEVIRVSYRDDPEVALGILLTACEGQARVLADPAPVSRLMHFSDSGIELELRFWISDPQEGVNNVRSEVNRTIWRLFKEHHITIPVAQREIIVHSGSSDHLD